MENQPYIAVIDDDYDDVFLLKECFEHLHFFSARWFYRGKAFFDSLIGEDYVLPSLIIVDLNMPEVNGIIVVRKIKEDPLLRAIPVFVFTTGGTPTEMNICEKLSVEVFKKPSSIKEWESIAFIMAAHCEPGLLKQHESH